MEQFTCPVCTSAATFGVRFCGTCAWVYEYSLGELEQHEQAEYEQRLTLARRIWERAGRQEGAGEQAGAVVAVGVTESTAESAPQPEKRLRRARWV